MTDLQRLSQRIAHLQLEFIKLKRDARNADQVKEVKVRAHKVRAHRRPAHTRYILR